MIINCDNVPCIVLHKINLSNKEYDDQNYKHCWYEYEVLYGSSKKMMMAIDSTEKDFMISNISFSEYKRSYSLLIDSIEEVK